MVDNLQDDLELFFYKIYSDKTNKNNPKFTLSQMIKWKHGLRLKYMSNYQSVTDSYFYQELPMRL